jgi:AcrR family transcriptional regulator
MTSPTTTNPNNPKMLNDDSTKERILQAAGPIFARQGFQSATVREICTGADVNLASINYYFGDKQKLYVEVVKAARDTQSGSFQFSAVPEAAPPAMLLEKFVEVLLQKLGVGSETSWQMELLVREFLFPGEACREIVEEYFRPYFVMLLRIIDRMAGVPLAPETRYQLGFSLIGQCLHYRLAGPIIAMFVDRNESNSHWTPAALARHIACFSIGGIERVVSAAK